MYPLSAPPPKEDVAKEKSVIPQPDHLDHNPTHPPPVVVDDSKALVIVLHMLTLLAMTFRSCSNVMLERVATEKRLSLVKAWEESEKSKAENK
ncbi:hypothetical protein KIW84_015175 [Lathyrus oleraceus]|uniref:Remorin N-terminal domain-containing protein n=1 Tax=Pisum sativum TaxID=3888 RepID=A0A9D5BPK4_PEA|nr:hypothetical protein KIW84_015175 [Pisum sativum]